MKTVKTRDDVVTTGVTKSVDLVKTRDDTHLTQASSRRRQLCQWGQHFRLPSTCFDHFDLRPSTLHHSVFDRFIALASRQSSAAAVLTVASHFYSPGRIYLWHGYPRCLDNRGRECQVNYSNLEPHEGRFEIETTLPTRALLQQTNYHSSHIVALTEFCWAAKLCVSKWELSSPSGV
jgi:hypothetical protein